MLLIELRAHLLSGIVSGFQSSCLWELTSVCVPPCFHRLDGRE
jgi:hypothetical protein